MKIILFILLSTSRVVCLPLQDDPILAKHFSREEVEQLDTVRTFFNQQILDMYSNGGDLEDCYQQYLESINTKSSLIQLNIAYDEQKGLYEKINKSLFFKIWKDSVTGRDPSTREMIKVRELGYNLKAEYMDFLKEVAQEEPYFK